MIQSAYFIKFVLLLSITFTIMQLNAQDIRAHRWENRILILKTTDTETNKFVNQLKEFSNQEVGLAERKLIMYKIVGEQYELVKFDNSDSKPTGQITEDFKMKYIQNNEDFNIILIGLDGGIKLQQQDVLSIETLLNTIDAMPMRQSEMKRESKN